MASKSAAILFVALGLAGCGHRPYDIPDRGLEAVNVPVVTRSDFVFDASAPDALLAVLAKYVVVSRGHPGCRNIDLCASATAEQRYVVIQKWASPQDQQRHFDSSEMVEMARACDGLLRSAPRIDLLHGISAHDLA